jgi:hypothetical protein
MLLILGLYGNAPSILRVDTLRIRELTFAFEFETFLAGLAIVLN